MARRVTPEQEAQIYELASKGLSQRDVAARVHVSVGLVNKVLASKAETKQPNAAPEMALEAPAVDLPDVAGLTDEAALSAALASLTAQREIAKANRDVARSIQVEKAISEVIARRAKLRPPTPEDPNASPKWQELAKRFRDLAHERLDRILADAGVKS